MKIKRILCLALIACLLVPEAALGAGYTGGRGAYGVFLVNDEILIRTRGNNELLAKNDSYPPIPYSEDIQPLAIVLGLPDHNGPLR